MLEKYCKNGYLRLDTKSNITKVVCGKNIYLNTVYYNHRWIIKVVFSTNDDEALYKVSSLW
jgi:hypothetical protein